MTDKTIGPESRSVWIKRVETIHYSLQLTTDELREELPELWQDPVTGEEDDPSIEVLSERMQLVDGYSDELWEETERHGDVQGNVWTIEEDE